LAARLADFCHGDIALQRPGELDLTPWQAPAATMLQAGEAMDAAAGRAAGGLLSWRYCITETGRTGSHPVAGARGDH
ncbi:hypothetical protein CKJ89_38230, partial [Klebsiella pneumoniae]